MRFPIPGRWIVAASLLVAAALTGCSGVKAPRVELRDVSIGEVSDEGFVLDFALDLNNPNTETLDLYEFEYVVTVNGRRLYTGRRSAQAALSPGGGQTVAVPAVVTFGDLGVDHVPDSLDYALNGSLWYVTPDELAQILFDSGVNRPNVGFTFTGRLTFGEDVPAVGGDATP